MSEPKPHIFFDPPQNNLSAKKFLALAQLHGVMLAPESLMLFVKDKFFINGEMFNVNKGEVAFFVQLADQRRAELSKPNRPAVIARLYDWYNNGYIRFAD
jgi:50S ribosomal protein L16 3-hydroxylase